MADAPPGGATAPPGGFRSRAWWMLLVAGAAGILISRLLPDGVPRSIPFQLAGPVSAAAIVVGVRLHRPPRPVAWYLMAAGLLIWSIADTVGSIGADLLGYQGFPTPADVVYLVGYPVVALGLLQLDRQRRGGVAGQLDSAILMVALGLLTWVLLAQPTLATLDVSTSAAAVSVAYPVADVVLAAILVRLVRTPWGRTPSFWLLVTGVLILLLADVLAPVLDQLDWSASDPIEGVWMASYLIWAAAALHPSVAEASRPSAESSGRSFSRGGLAALAVALITPGAILAVKELTGQAIDVWPIVVGSILTCVLVMIRIGVAVRQLEQAQAEQERARVALAHQAAHDPLTGLPNRAQGMVVLRAALNRARRASAMVGLLFIDLDGFKQVNDTLGHAAGDEVLAVAGGRMQQAVRAGDTVARLGGDEFVVLLEPVASEVDAVRVAERLVADLAEPIPLSTGREARIGASIGVAINSDGAVDPDRLLQEADHAVFRAKAGGRGRVEVFAPSLRAEVERRAAVEAAIVAALRQGTATVETDPVVDLRVSLQAGRRLEVAVTGPGGESWPRHELVPLTRGTDKLCDLDSWVLRTGVLGQPDDDGWLMVPVTGRHLAQGTIVADVTAALQAGLEAERLMLLVPTDELGGVRVLDTLAQLRGLGVRICADSFGADDSGTDRWARVPLDYVQLDRRLLSAAGGGLLLRLTVETANAFGYGVVAPGIATEADADVLAAAGCELGLGPLYAGLTAGRR